MTLAIGAVGSFAINSGVPGADKTGVKGRFGVDSCSEAATGVGALSNRSRASCRNLMPATLPKIAQTPARKLSHRETPRNRLGLATGVAPIKGVGEGTRRARSLGVCHQYAS